MLLLFCIHNDVCVEVLLLMLVSTFSRSMLMVVLGLSRRCYCLVFSLDKEGDNNADCSQVGLQLRKPHHLKRNSFVAEDRCAGPLVTKKCRKALTNDLQAVQTNDLQALQILSMVVLSISAPFNPGKIPYCCQSFETRMIRFITWEGAPG